ncbi:hypothetical protein KFK09_000750 [Dendrobium nobile]|uniref:Uncharacterized protein n=1 Tax=Dendrobium nobile TaxID=94219 RepID=A0A8T3CDZ2_DENNO|nr:hypothetical protein KFK09_000750 [Dendrobium nobile]
MKLTRRDMNFPISPEACDFGSWRNLPVVDIEHNRHTPLLRQGSSRILNVSGLNLLNHDHDSDVMDLSQIRLRPPPA